MEQYVQPARLLPYRVPGIIVACCMLIAVTSGSCSKTEVLTTGNPGKSTREFSFVFSRGAAFDESLMKEVSVKVKLSLSCVDLAEHATNLLWDTVIAQHNLYDYLNNTNLAPVTTTLEGPPQTLRYLVAGYVIIYNKQGELTTRSGVTRIRESGKENVLITL
jgi:hypothetical protein